MKPENVRIGVIRFPGSLDHGDAARAVRLAGATPIELWHASHSLDGVEGVIIPGGFSYGDYLRTGAIARFAPLMREIIRAAQAPQALPVLGICNGFQILTEAGLLPGALIRNEHLTFHCQDHTLQLENTSTTWTCAYEAGQAITIPVKHHDGQYVADEKTLDALESNAQVLARYRGTNPNGSRRNIAGICNKRGNVVGLMPHPEHAVEPGFGPDSPSGPRTGTDGIGFFHSIMATVAQAGVNA